MKLQLGSHYWSVSHTDMAPWRQWGRLRQLRQQGRWGQLHQLHQWDRWGQLRHQVQESPEVRSALLGQQDRWGQSHTHSNAPVWANKRRDLAQHSAWKDVLPHTE